jgi:hypothetical protein
VVEEDLIIKRSKKKSSEDVKSVFKLCQETDCIIKLPKMETDLDKSLCVCVINVTMLDAWGLG